MPLYEYSCGDHTVERVRPIGMEYIQCPECGYPAQRAHVYHTEIVGPTVDTRGMFRRYSEASSEIDYKASVVEYNTGAEVRTPNLWAAAKGRAAAITRAGENYRPLEGS